MSAAHEYETLADLARQKARESMHRGSPVAAREWIETAHAATSAALDLQTGARIATALEQMAQSLAEWDFDFHTRIVNDELRVVVANPEIARLLTEAVVTLGEPNCPAALLQAERLARGDASG